jgi:hypothetical protein
VIAAGVVLAVVAVVLQTIGFFANAFFLEYGIWNLDADRDGNALAWASSVATFAAALGALLLGLLAPTGRWQMFGMAAALSFLSLDDAAAIHEKLASRTVQSLDFPAIVGHAFWPLLYLPLLAFVVFSLWRLATNASKNIRRPMLLGIALLAAAVAAEMASSLWRSEDSRPLVDDLEIAFEEGAELAGWILIATAVLGIVVDRLVRIGKSTERPGIAGL